MAKEIMTYAEEQLTQGNFYCRKCMKFLPERNFYKAVDKKRVDTNGKISVCKSCAQDIYDELFEVTPIMEKVIHTMCTTLNVAFVNNAIDATKAHIDTLMENGKNVKAIFSIYLQKLVAVNPTMDKSADTDMTYTDVTTIYTDKQFEVKDSPIPKDVLDFWGDKTPIENVKFLEKEYTKLKTTHVVKTYAEETLAKQICHAVLDIENTRLEGEDVTKMVTSLQTLMKSLDIAPNIANANLSTEDDDTFGLWIQEIEKSEPAQWLKDNPKYRTYRDVDDIDKYYKQYIVRATKNFITESRDFNIEGNDSSELLGLKEEDDDEQDTNYQENP